MVAVGGHRETRRGVIGDRGDHIVSRKFEGDHHRITFDGTVTVEKAAEVVDLADTDGASFDLCWHDDTGRNELLGQRQVTRGDSVVGHSEVEVDLDFGLGMEHDLAGEAFVTSAVEDNPARLRTCCYELWQRSASVDSGVEGKRHIRSTLGRSWRLGRFRCASGGRTRSRRRLRAPSLVR